MIHKYCIFTIILLFIFSHLQVKFSHLQVKFHIFSFSLTYVLFKNMFIFMIMYPFSVWICLYDLIHVSLHSLPFIYIFSLFLLYSFFCMHIFYIYFFPRIIEKLNTVIVFLRVPTLEILIYLFLYLKVTTICTLISNNTKCFNILILISSLLYIYFFGF